MSFIGEDLPPSGEGRLFMRVKHSLETLLGFALFWIKSSKFEIMSILSRLLARMFSSEERLSLGLVLDVICVLLGAVLP